MGMLWTDKEDRFIKERYKTDGAEEIAVYLGRSRRGVYQRARALGVSESKCFATNQQIIDHIKKLHPKGWSDAQIAKDLAQQLDTQVDRHRVGVLRRQLNLPTNNGSQHQRDRVAMKTAEQLEKAGLSSIGHLRSEAFNKYKRDLGWPTELTIRAVQALELFYQRGPMTRMQLCAAMGIDKKQRLKRTEPVSNAKGGTVLAELQRAELVMRLKKAVKSGRGAKGTVRRVDLYMLCPGVKPNDQRCIETSRREGNGHKRSGNC